MRRMIAWCVVSLLFAATSGLAQEEKTASKHVMMSPGDVTWSDPPAMLPKGAKLAVLSGDPASTGVFTIRLMVPKGYKVAPHWHPTDEHVTVIEGTLSLGMGESFDKAALKDLREGSYALLPAEMRHFAFAKSKAILQVHGTGPFTMTYVNPADDPSKTPTTP